jgi:hypothetical protein
VPVAVSLTSAIFNFGGNAVGHGRD